MGKEGNTCTAEGRHSPPCLFEKGDTADCGNDREGVGLVVGQTTHPHPSWKALFLSLIVVSIQRAAQGESLLNRTRRWPSSARVSKRVGQRASEELAPFHCVKGDLWCWKDLSVAWGLCTVVLSSLDFLLIKKKIKIDVFCPCCEKSQCPFFPLWLLSHSVSPL